MLTPLGFLGFSGGWEWIVILIAALLLFGKRLPEVMRSMGRGIVEFKKGVKGIEDDIDSESQETKSISKPPQSLAAEDRPMAPPQARD